jgi:hypothetical protein
LVRFSLCSLDDRPLGCAPSNQRSAPAKVPRKRAFLLIAAVVLEAFLRWIANQGYQVENHSILTEDGYILNVQRIHSSTTLGLWRYCLLGQVTWNHYP